MITEQKYRETIEAAAVAAETGEWSEDHRCRDEYVDLRGID